MHSLSNFFQERLYLENSAKLILNFYEEGEKHKSISKDKRYDVKIKNFNTVKFQNVNFSYDDHKIFKNLNFEINLGQKIGFKSKSGSGKSTFIFLMLGISFQQFSILKDDIDHQLIPFYINNYAYQNALFFNSLLLIYLVFIY